MKYASFYWLAFILIALLTALTAVSCDQDDSDEKDSGDDDVTDDDASDDDATDDDSSDDDVSDDDDDDSTPPPGCDTLIDGWNEHYMVDGVSRSFYLDLPDGVEESWPWPIVFNWHGFGDTAANMRNLIKHLVNNETFPFIGISVEDSNMLFDWDILDAEYPQNREVLLFDSLIGELDKCFGVNYEHIHTTGFSFGGVISDMLGVVRGDVIASIATCSGGYACNPANGFPTHIASWPPLTTENKYTELRLHGGILDNMFLPFGTYGDNDRVYLRENGHDVVGCKHDDLHNRGFLHMDSANFIQFFEDHPLGTEVSPYNTQGLPEDFPDICVFEAKY